MAENTQYLDIEDGTLDFFVDLVRKSGRFQIVPLQDPSISSIPPAPQGSMPPLHDPNMSSIPPTSKGSIPPQLSYHGGALRPPIQPPPPLYNRPPGPRQVHSTPAHTYPMPRPYVSFGPDITRTNTGSSSKMPKLTEFAGPGKDCQDMYDIWVYEVNCLIRSMQYSDHVILEAIRKSLKGKARLVLLHLGDQASLTDILREMECLYGNVASSEKLKEQFYSAHQESHENVADYSLRLEQLLRHSAVDLRPAAKNEMLRSRLWSGLRDGMLKNVSRYKYESINDFNELRKELRKMEQDLKSGMRVSGEKIESSVGQEKERAEVKAKDDSAEKVELASAQMTAIDSRLLKQMQEMTDQFKKMNSRMDGLEKEVREMKKGSYGNKQEGQGWNQKKKWGNNNNWKGNKNDKDNQKSEKGDNREKDLNSQRPPSQGP